MGHNLTEIHNSKISIKAQLLFACNDKQYSSRAYLFVNGVAQQRQKCIRDKFSGTFRVYLISRFDPVFVK